jgi:hypothetical protein
MGKSLNLRACLDDMEKKKSILSKGIEPRFPDSKDSILDTIPTELYWLVNSEAPAFKFKQQRKPQISLFLNSKYDKPQDIKTGSLLYTPTFTIHNTLSVPDSACINVASMCRR